MSETNSALKPGDILLSKNVIQKRVAELAAEISREYRGDELVIVGVLKGAVIFMSDLARLVSDEVDVRMDFLAVSSYGTATSSSGAVKIMKDIDAPAEGRNILLVEDIMDTGLTLSYLKGMIKPAILRACEPASCWKNRRERK
jgi:hypoxanthine phosphoribosyltransferase